MVGEDGRALGYGATITIVYGDRSRGDAGDSCQASLAWDDRTPLRDTAANYLRVEQVDGEMAWASPVWVVANGVAGNR